MQCLGLAIAVLLAAPAMAIEGQVMQTATGQFTVRLSPAAATVDGTQRLTIDKQFTGDLLASSHGEMMSAGDPGKGEAGYVALELVDGTLAGRAGRFALQHSGTMSGGRQALLIQIVPGSGSGALAGISGQMAIRIEGGVHHYTLRYALPAAP
jgi:hypothetical protein